MRTHRTNRPGGFILAGIAAVALLGGSAFTNANTMDATDTVGYGSTTVSGATVNSLSYTLNSAGDQVSSVTLVLNGDTSSSSVAIGFNDGSTSSCGTGNYDGTTATTYTCNDAANFPQATSALVKTAVVVS